MHIEASLYRRIRQVMPIACVEELVFTDPPVRTINTVMRADVAGQAEAVRLDSTQSDFAWMTHVPSDLHPCVASPLLKLGFPPAPMKRL